MHDLFPANERGLIRHSHQAKVTPIPNEVVCTPTVIFHIFSRIVISMVVNLAYFNFRNPYMCSSKSGKGYEYIIGIHLQDVWT